MTKYAIVEKTKGTPLLPRISVCLKDPIYLRDTLRTTARRGLLVVVFSMLGLFVHPLFFIPGLFSLGILLFTLFCLFRG